MGSFNDLFILNKNVYKTTDSGNVVAGSVAFSSLGSNSSAVWALANIRALIYPHYFPISHRINGTSNWHRFSHTAPYLSIPKW